MSKTDRKYRKHKELVTSLVFSIALLGVWLEHEYLQLITGAFFPNMSSGGWSLSLLAAFMIMSISDSWLKTTKYIFNTRAFIWIWPPILSITALYLYAQFHIWFVVFMLPIFFMTAYVLNLKARIRKSTILWSFFPDLLVLVALSLLLFNIQDGSKDYVSIFILLYFFFGHMLDPISSAVFMHYRNKREKENEEIQEIYGESVYKSQETVVSEKKFNHLFGKDEEMDKEISLLLLSLIFWLTLTVDYYPKTSIQVDNPGKAIVESTYITTDRIVGSTLQSVFKNGEQDNVVVEQRFVPAKKDPHRYYFSLFIVALFLFLLSILKYNLKFNYKENKPLKVEKSHKDYTCQKTENEAIVGKFNDNDCVGKFNDCVGDCLGKFNDCVGDCTKVFCAKVEEASTAKYELAKDAYQGSNLEKREEKLKEGLKDFLNKLVKEEGESEKERTKWIGYVDPRMLNDYAILLIANHKLDNKDNPSKVNHIVVQEVIEYLVIAGGRHSCAIYNLCVFLIKMTLDKGAVYKSVDDAINSRQENSILSETALSFLAESENINDVIEHLLMEAVRSGHARAHNLKINWQQNREHKLENLEYELVADYSSTDALSHSEKFSKPVDIFILVSRGLSIVFATYILMLIFKHPQTAGMSYGVGLFSVVGFGLTMLFKTSVASFIAGIRIFVGDFARIGDRVESRELNISGRVYKFSLTSIKIINFDNSVNNIPLIEFLEADILNWRLLKNERGRRIEKRIWIDVRSVKRIDKEIYDKISNIKILKDILKCKQEEFEDTNKEKDKAFDEIGNAAQDETSNSNAELYAIPNILDLLSYQAKSIVLSNALYAIPNILDLLSYQAKSIVLSNARDKHYPDYRFATNLGLFRNYIRTYLYGHDMIDGSKDVIVSHKEITAEGLSIEVRAFTHPTEKYTAYKPFRNLESDIFEHIIASAEYFDIKMFQYSVDENRNMVKSRSK